MSMNNKPKWWFRSLEELTEIVQEPEKIEFLKNATGETFIHDNCTVYWNYSKQQMDRDALERSGITHWRIKD